MLPFTLPPRVCGVSYLVFSEIKSLQRRTEEAENTMLEWKVCVHCYFVTNGLTLVDCC